jgi:hypothetical protein
MAFFRIKGEFTVNVFFRVKGEFTVINPSDVVLIEGILVNT